MQHKLATIKKLMNENRSLFRGKIGREELRALDEAIRSAHIEETRDPRNEFDANAAIFRALAPRQR